MTRCYAVLSIAVLMLTAGCSRKDHEVALKMDAMYAQRLSDLNAQLSAVQVDILNLDLKVAGLPRCEHKERSRFVESQVLACDACLSRNRALAELSDELRRRRSEIQHEISEVTSARNQAR